MNDIEIDQTIKPVRMVVAAMAGGIVALTAVAVGLVNSGAANTDPELTSTLLLVLAMTEVPAYFVLRQVILAGVRRWWESGDQKLEQTSARQWGQSYARLTLIGIAMTEGLALYCIVIYLLTAHLHALLPPLAALLLLGLLLPTRARFHRFVTTITGQAEYLR